VRGESLPAGGLVGAEAEVDGDRDAEAVFLEAAIDVQG